MCSLTNKHAFAPQSNEAAKGQTVNLSEHSMGVPPELKGKGDQALCDALKILRLLHLKDLRGLQVQIRTFNYNYPR